MLSKNQLEQALRAGEDLFRNVIESSADIVAIVEDDGKIRYFNPTVTRHLGWTTDELIGNNAFQLVHPDDLTNAMDAFRLGIEDYKRNPPVELRIRAADGTYRLYEAASSHYFEQGVRVGLVCSFRGISDRKQAELDLRESERKYRLLFERNVAGVYLARLDGRILDCNDAAAHVFGFSNRHELIHKDANLLYEDPTERTRFVEDVVRRGHLTEYEARYRRNDGNLVWILESVSVFEPEPGAELLLQGTLVDITERKRSEQLQSALYRIANLSTSGVDSSHYYEQLHAILADLMYAKNFYVALLDDQVSRLEFLYFSDERERNPGVRAISNGLTEYVLRTGQPLLADRTVSHDLQASGEVRLLGPDSTEWLGAPLLRNGAAVGVIALQNYGGQRRYVAADVELLNFVAQQIASAVERQRGQQALRESEERYRSLFETAVHGICRCSISQDTFIDINPALVQMLGHGTAEDAKHVRVSSIFSDAAEVAAVIKEFRRKERVEGREVRWLRRDGSALNVRLGGRVVPEQPDILELIVEDVTQRRILEERLNHTQRMEAVGQLASGIAHEFNNLLTVIRGYSELMLTRDLNSSQAETLGEITRATAKAGDLTRQLQTFSRTHQSSPCSMSLNSLIQGLSPLLERMLRGRARLNLHLAPDLPLIHADPHALEQAIVNLVMNARDAVHDSGEVFIETHTGLFDGQRWALLKVRDNGIGMQPEVRKRIFEPFFTTKGVGKGTGLGLSAVYGIVQHAGGFVSVDSEEGSGTAITAHFPAQKPQERDAPSPSIRRTVLVVEDQAALRNLLAEVLAKRGFEVIAAASAEEALIAFGRAPQVDLLLTDIQLGAMTGTELAFRLSKDYPRLGVILTSGYLPDIALDPKRANSFLAKPFTAEALMAKVDQILSAAEPL